MASDRVTFFTKKHILRLGLWVVACLCGVVWSGCKRQQTPSPHTAKRKGSQNPVTSRAAKTAVRRPVTRGINARFLKPGVTATSWKKRFESNKREVFIARKAIVAALSLKPGQAVADLGAGTGVHIKPILDVIGPKGTLYAVELAPIFVRFLTKFVKSKGYKNVKVVKSTSAATNLPGNALDLIFICATFHHFDQPVPMLKDIHRALRPGGRLVIVDFKRIPGVSSKWLLNHVKQNKKQVTEQIVQNGFQLKRAVKLKQLKENYFLIFEKKTR